MKLKVYAMAAVLTLPAGSFALVDYSDGDSSFRPKSSGAVRLNKSSQPATANFKKRSSSSSVSSRAGGLFKGGIGISSNYRTITVSDGVNENKANIYSFEGTIRPVSNAFLRLSYWHSGKNEIYGPAGDDDSGKGNPKFIMGLNWLRVGRQNNSTNLDLYGGVIMEQRDSTLATSRRDKILGLETIKHFYNLAFGFNFEYRMTGTPESDQETDIGTIKKLSASVGIKVGQDIMFSLEGGTYLIGSLKSSERTTYLDKSVSFGYVVPTLNLRLSSRSSLVLGAEFRAKKAEDSRLLGARLWDLNGAYGNSIFGGLSMRL